MNQEEPRTQGLIKTILAAAAISAMIVLNWRSNSMLESILQQSLPKQIIVEVHNVDEVDYIDINLPKCGITRRVYRNKGETDEQLANRAKEIKDQLEKVWAS